MLRTRGGSELLPRHRRDHYTLQPLTAAKLWLSTLPDILDRSSCTITVSERMSLEATTDAMAAAGI